MQAGDSSTDRSPDRDALDPGAVRALTDLLGGDREALAEVVDAFLEEAPQRLVELREGTAAGDAILAGRAAHTLKANATTFGAQHLASLCLRLETGARAGDLATLAHVVDDVDVEWLAVRPRLVELRDDGGQA